MPQKRTKFVTLTNQQSKTNASVEIFSYLYNLTQFPPSGGFRDRHKHVVNQLDMSIKEVAALIKM